MLIIAAAALIPLAALAGSAIDIARLNVVQVRLQQACDAGVLAGRKFMAESTSTTLDSNATAKATQFFNNNFQTGWFTTNSRSFTPTKVLVDGTYQVSGTASVKVPMTIMTMFGMPTSTLTVNCQASFDTPDTDVMFVLDTTGSMACLPSDSTSACGSYAAANSANSYTRSDGTTGYFVKEKSGSRIESLRQAVLTFYDTVAASMDASTHVRYGFVPYTSTVNVGFDLRDMSASYLANRPIYQTRMVTGDSGANDGTATVTYNVTSEACLATASRSPATPNVYNRDGTATDKRASWVKTSGTKGTCTLQPRKLTPIWTYDNYELDATSYIAGGSSTGSAEVDDPGTVDVNTNKSKWQGCIEERRTIAGATTFDIKNLPLDLDPNAAPVATNIDTQWKPMWQDVIYQKARLSTTIGDTSANPLATVSNAQLGYFSCGKRVRRLFSPAAGAAGRQQIYDYVYATDFKAIGGTYHDVGMIWGTRMLAPKGIFKADTAAWPNRREPHRMIVFMTDGEMQPNASVYGFYGIEFYLRRVTGAIFGTGDPDGTTANLNKYRSIHNARFLAECAKAKDEGIDVWVVALGQDLNDELEACATVSGQALQAKSSAELTAAFKTIAKQVAMLRVTK